MALAVCSKDGSAGTINPVSFKDPAYMLFLDRLRYQRLTGRFCDATLHLDNKTEFRVHRAVLAANSPYFDSVLAFNRVTHEKIYLSGHSEDIVSAVLNYMYGDAIVLDRLNIVRLKSYCFEYLEKSLDAANCLHVKTLGETYEIPKLVSKAVDFFKRNVEAVFLQNRDILNMPFKEVNSLFSKYAAHIHADVFFGLLIRWTGHDTDKRQYCFDHMLKQIHVQKLTLDKIENILDFNPFFIQSERCLFLVLNELKCKGCMSDKYAPKLNELAEKYDGIENNVPLDSADEDIQSDEDGLTRNAQVQMNDGSSQPLKLRLKLSQPKKKHRSSKSDDGVRRKRGRPRLIRPTVPDVNLADLNEEPDDCFYRFDEDNDTSAAFDEAEDLNPEDITPEDQDEPDEQEDVADVQCPHCEFRAKSKAKFKRHQAIVHSLNVLYVCNICSFECRWNKSFYEHMRHHFQTIPFQCDFCPYTVDRMHVLLSHRLTHTDEKPYKCPQCDFRTRSRGNLIVHHRIHSGERPFKCLTCGKTFAMKSTLNQHMAAHSENRPFQCDQCSFSTKYQSHLISHRRIHTGDLFRCQEPGCEYVSPKKSQLAAHLRTHLAVRPHQCKTCNRSFIERSHLIRHERIHLKDKPFKCDLCDYASSRRDKLKEHVLKHHSSTSKSKQYRHKSKKNRVVSDTAKSKQFAPPGPSNVFRPIPHDFDRIDHSNSLPLGYDEELAEINSMVACHSSQQQVMAPPAVQRQHSVPIDFCHNQDMGMEPGSSQMLHHEPHIPMPGMGGILMDQGMPPQQFQSRSYSNTDMSQNMTENNFNATSSSLSCHNYPMDFGMPRPTQQPTIPNLPPQPPQDMRNTLGYGGYMEQGLAPGQMMQNAERPMSQPNLRSYTEMPDFGLRAPPSGSSQSQQARNQTEWYPHDL